MDEPLTCRQVAEQHPDHEIVRVRYRIPSDHYPQGFEAVLMIPRAKIAAVIEPSWFRHGETMTISPVPSA